MPDNIFEVLSNEILWDGVTILKDNTQELRVVRAHTFAYDTLKRIVDLFNKNKTALERAERKIELLQTALAELRSAQERETNEY